MCASITKSLNSERSENISARFPRTEKLIADNVFNACEYYTNEH